MGSRAAQAKELKQRSSSKGAQAKELKLRSSSKGAQPKELKQRSLSKGAQAKELKHLEGIHVEREESEPCPVPESEVPKSKFNIKNTFIVTITPS